MYPKTVVFENYYANFDDIGKILYDMLEQDRESFWYGDITDVGYYFLSTYGNYFVKQHSTNYVSIYGIELREKFNAVEIPQTINNKREETDEN